MIPVQIEILTFECSSKGSNNGIFQNVNLKDSYSYGNN